MNEIDILELHAVDAAVACNWNDALKINKQILDSDKNNVQAHLRLGFIHLNKNEFDKARKYYQKALKLSPSNSVAINNLERLMVLKTKKSNKKVRQTPILLNPNLFLEITGKTKSIPLVNLGQKNLLAETVVGEEVFLNPKRRKMEVRTKSSEYIGSLPDDISKRLILFIKAGSHYSVFVKEAGLSRIVIFVKEDRKGKKVQNYLSFPINNQSSLKKINLDKDDTDNHEEIVHNELEIEQLAESLTTTEEKEYLPYHPEEEREDDDE